MNKSLKKTEITVNILIIFATIVLGAVLIKSYLPASNRHKGVRNPQEARSLLKIDGFDFSEQSKTLIVALQRGCPYCTQSAPFYKQLINRTKDRNIKIVAIFPEPDEKNQDYIQKIGISDIRIIRESFDVSPIQLTPTLILADDQGEIIKVWTGMLSPSKEAEVIKDLDY